MNTVILMGRLTKDPDVKMTQSQKAVCSFTIAVDRRFKNANGEREADFISCVAWGKTAELLGQYFSRGSRIGVTGSLQARDYEGKDGKRVYVTEVSVENIDFVDSKKDEPHYEKPDCEAPAETMPPVMDDDISLPFDL